MTLPKFSDKHPSEDLLLTVDFSRVLDGESLVSSVWACSVQWGVDALPGAMLPTAAAVSGSLAQQRVIGGISGNVYTLTALATTVSGRVYVEKALLSVQS